MRQINSQSDSRKTSFFGARGSAVCFLEFGHGVVVGDCWCEIGIGEVARPWNECTFTEAGVVLPKPVKRIDFRHGTPPCELARTSCGSGCGALSRSGGCCS